MPSKKPSKKIKPPKGTRDLYPEDLLRQRYITNAWRDASIRCGFEEIAGPTFESTELYSVKSGDGILNELFQAFSGKSDKEIEQVRQTGQAPYALRPEFTPTLARMYAAHAKQLPKPCKWFTAGPYFRAERPQRGRLREFLQWNVDVIGDDGSEFGGAFSDAECLLAMVMCFHHLGFTSNDIQIPVGDRSIVEFRAREAGISESKMADFLSFLDGMPKRSANENDAVLLKLGFELDAIEKYNEVLRRAVDTKGGDVESVIQNHLKLVSVCRFFELGESEPDPTGQWCQCFNTGIVRGLAYYTGTVFEAIADGERAVAGGGRYDNLIELFGGPPTPACGFGMGDVVLGNLLDDKALMPTGIELKEAVARPQASIRPQAFIVPNGDPDNEPLVHTLAANLRRGIESEQWLAREGRKPWDKDRYAVAPLHARISYKSTRKINKLKADASDQHAKFFVEIHSDNKVELTNMDTREPITSPVGSFHVDPANEHYIGKAIANLL